MNTTEESRTKFLKNENFAFEARLVAIKSEIESLKKIKETLQTDIEEAKERHNREIEQKHNSVRALSTKVDDNAKKLETDKSEFQGILSQFQKEKNEFIQEKQKTDDLRNDAKKSMDRVGAFIVLIRNEASKL